MKIPGMIGVVSLLEGLTFFVMAVAHMGRPLTAGFASLSEPRIVPATIVEAACGAVLLLAAFALFAARSWSRNMALAAHILAVCGVLLGMAALAAGRGPRTATNDIYHRLILFVLLVMTLFIARTRFSSVDR
jgi:hypothetical protein